MEIVVRASVIFWLLWFLLRASGKRELAEITPFELIVLMVMGDLIQQGVTQEDMSVTGAALSVTTIMLWTLLLSYLNFRNRALSRVLDSRPAVLVSHGQVDNEMLRIHRLSTDDLLDEARNAGIARIAEIEYAVLDADGKVSFIKVSGEPIVRTDDDGPT
jgi:uncharacterized membrane protein YcaP (DUF421 family)